jgi:hypothetical protein
VKTEAPDLLKLISDWERDDQTSFALYLEFRVLNVALSRMHSANPIESMGPSTSRILTKISEAYPDLSSTERMSIKHAVDRYIWAEKLPLKYMKVDPAIMPKDVR